MEGGHAPKIESLANISYSLKIESLVNISHTLKIESLVNIDTMSYRTFVSLGWRPRTAQRSATA